MPETYYVTYNGVVLIDTWWNVNKEYLDTTKAIDGVLIDTWWNVNMILMDWQKALIEF